MASSNTNKTVIAIGAVAIVGYVAYKALPKLLKKIGGSGGSGGSGGASSYAPYNPYSPNQQQEGSGLQIGVPQLPGQSKVSAMSSGNLNQNLINGSNNQFYTLRDFDADLAAGTPAGYASENANLTSEMSYYGNADLVAGTKAESDYLDESVSPTSGMDSLFNLLNGSNSSSLSSNSSDYGTSLIPYEQVQQFDLSQDEQDVQNYDDPGNAQSSDQDLDTTGYDLSGSFDDSGDFDSGGGDSGGGYDDVEY